MSRILIGTAKGLVVIRDSADPKITDIHFQGLPVTMVHIDKRHNRWWCGISHRHWGQKLHFSDDEGTSWQEAGVPGFEGAKLPDGNTAKLRQIWCMATGNSDHPDELWLGTDPGGLFHSTDNGKSFQLVESLWNHPSRKVEGQWFGAGSDHPFIHSIVINPSDSEHIYIAVSCAGVFESRDGGKSWNARNNGLVAAYLPNPNVDVGHDPHLLLMHPEDTSVMWQQNHCGIFVSRDAGATWQDVSGKGGIPYYGFAITIDVDRPEAAWVIPVLSDEQRIAPDLHLDVYQTTDFGASWARVSEGLPDRPVFDIVLRQAFARNREFMVFGTTNGNVYYTKNENIKWRLISGNLTKVNTVIIEGN